MLRCNVRTKFCIVVEYVLVVLLLYGILGVHFYITFFSSAYVLTYWLEVELCVTKSMQYNTDSNNIVLLTTYTYITQQFFYVRQLLVNLFYAHQNWVIQA